MIGSQKLSESDKVEDIPAPRAPLPFKHADIVNPQPEDQGAFDAALQGGFQGASFGFFDEIASGLQALAESHDIRNVPSAYRSKVAEMREDMHTAQAQHPVAFGAGELAGGLATAAIPGAGMASLGRGFAANAARGAGAGILTGAGSSEAQDLEGVVKDAARGGLVGGATGGVLGTVMEHLTGGAAGRADQRLLSDIGDRATPTARKKIADAAELVKGAAKKFDLERVAQDPNALHEATQAATKQVGEKIGSAYQTMGDEVLGARASKVLQAVRGVKAELSGPSEAPLRKAVDRYMADVEERWGKGARNFISLRDLNAEIGNLEKVGFAGADLTPVAGKQLKRDLAHALEDVLQERLDEVKDLGGKLANSSLAKREGFSGIVRSSEAAQSLADLNRDYRGLKLIGRAAAERARLTPFSPTGLRQIAGDNVGKLLLFTGHPFGAIAEHIGAKAMPALARGADKVLANLYAAAQAGQLTAQMIQQAIEVGVPRSLIEGLAPSVTDQRTAP